MQCRAVDYQIVVPQESLNETLDLTLTEATEDQTEESAVRFQTHFEGYMEMYRDAQSVAQYLDAHEGWFCRCSQPMKVEPIGNNGYILTVGKFGAFGYEVEPKIAVVLQPPQEGVYLMNSIPVPNYQAPGYDVDYQASMELQEIPVESAKSDVAAVYKKHKISQLPAVITQVKWELHMDVAVQFPKFIRKLPACVIQRTGDRLLAQIVRQISPRLTQKVQQDFHSRFNLPNPPKNAISLQRISQQDDEEFAA
ncbi:MAG: DUF1997 domain-containing protein [Hydrococcus sp. Prado102]|jgi:hypothetical protein|nr:DUF1997 domain-containing protein [Hydrococcus sp. Prado102]